MYIRISIPDLIAVTVICTVAWVTAGHTTGWSTWIGLGAFGLGRLVQFFKENE